MDARRRSEEHPTHAFVPLPNSCVSTSSSAHNSYSDLKNEWHSGAKPSALPSLRPCLFTLILALSLLALAVLTSYKLWLARQLSLQASLPRLPPQVLVVPEDCSRRTKDLVDFAAEQNGGKVLAALTSPPYHGRLMVSST